LAQHCSISFTYFTFNTAIKKSYAGTIRSAEEDGET